MISRKNVIRWKPYGELGAEIQRAISSLPNDQKTVMVLIDVQGLSYDEAAVSLT